MTHLPSRKEFFAKLLGATAAIGVSPKLLAKPAQTSPRAAEQPAPAARFVVRSDARAVARAESV